MAIEEKRLASYEVKYYFMFCVSIRILPYRNVIYDTKEMISVRNSVGQNILNYAIYTIDSTVTATFTITEYAGNKVS
jgi:hypothetical protein